MRAATSSLLILLSLGCHGAGLTPDARPDAGTPPPSDGGTDAAFDPLDAASDDAAAPIDAGPPPADWLATGGVSSCASHDGRVDCWGATVTGGTLSIPTAIGGLAGASQVALQRSHACAVFPDGHVACAGDNRTGVLGVPVSELDARATFEPVPGVTDAVEVAAGRTFVCARLRDGSVTCWGDDSVGQTGSPIPSHSPGAAAPQPTPLPVAGITGAVAIAAGQYHACAVIDDGRVRCWGYDWWGALGRGAGYTGSAQSTPADVEGLDDAVAVAIDSNSSCALHADGAVSCWGAEVHRWPGYDPATADVCPVVVEQVCWRAPRLLPGVAGAVEVDMGAGAVCIRSASAWECWGRDETGIVTGDGSPRASITDLAVGLGHVCVRESDGAIACRGRGDEGQLGDGLSTSSLALVRPVFP